jgi:hypothetical protein
MDDESAVANSSEAHQLRARLRTPRAAAVAGILFSLLLVTSLWLLRLSLPADPLEAGAWLETSSRSVTFALNLVPFAGVAFMWFIGVLRDRLGELEDQFFATVFLGSGFLFLGMMFIAASAIGGLVLAHSLQPRALFEGGTFAFARALSYNIMHIYAFKMAAVFMVSASTLAIRTRITARWIALLGYAAALILLLVSGYFDWVLFVFPAWVLLVSIYILTDNMRSSSRITSNDGER